MNGNLSVFVDRKNQISTNTNDAGNRVTQIVETSETTAHGSVNYTYHNANRRSAIFSGG